MKNRLNLVLTTLLLGLSISSEAGTPETRQSGRRPKSTVSSSASAQTVDPAASERVAALSRRLAITSFLSLPEGVTAMSLAPGAQQPTLVSQAERDAFLAASVTPADPAVVVQSRAVMQTPGGYIATAPVNGLTPGSYAVVHSDGTVSVNAPDGTALWNRSSFEFTQSTGRYPTRVNGTVTPATPVIAIGLDPIAPFVIASPNPFALGDLNGDGVDDIALAHFFSAVIAISGNTGGTFVSVVDGSNGNLVWSQMYPGIVANVAIQDGMLVVGNQTGNVQSQLGQNGSVSNLDAWRFSTSGGPLQVSHAWTVSTGAQWAPWLALEKLPNGKIAAAWTNTPEGSGNATLATELVVTLATGAVDWSVATTGYPRFLRFDSSRNQVVAVEEADPFLTYAYSLVARNLADGSVANSFPQSSATALNFQIGDLDGDGNSDWVVSDIGYLPCAPVGCVGVQNSGRVLALNGSTGATEWSQIRTGEPINPDDILGGPQIPQPYGLLIAPTATGADVLVGSFMGGGDIELERLNGALDLDGPAATVLWSQVSKNAFLPLFISLYAQDGNQFVRAASSRPKLYGFSVTFNGAGATVYTDGRTPFRVVRSFDIGNGNQVSAVPLLGRIHSAVGTKVNGDNIADIIVGGESGAVFALDGTKIDDHPIYLWRRTVAGPVHQVDTADLDGDGRDEIVVAASQAIDVLDSATGNLRYEIPYATDYIWSFVLTDLNEDGKSDILVPGASSLTAYAGPNGATLWAYTPSGTQAVGTLFGNVAITPDNIVTVQYAFGTQGVGRTGSGFTRALVGINGATGTVLWSATNAGTSPIDSTFSSFPQFWSGTVAGQIDGILGSVVGYSWVGYDSSKDAGGVCDSCFTPEMEIRDALTGTIISALPPPWIYNGSQGTLLIPEKGILSYAGNASWLLTTTDSGQALGRNIPMSMARGNFGALGKRVVEGDFPYYLLVFPEDGIDISSWESPTPVSARFNSAVQVTQIRPQDLDGDGSDEILRLPNDIDGQTALVAHIQGFGYEPTLNSDGLDILAVGPVPVPLSKVVSRQTHGSSGTFDVDLPLSGSPGIECRRTDNGNYTLVFSFANPLTSVDSAAVDDGTVAVSGAIGADPREYVISLTGVSHRQRLNITLTNVRDASGNLSPVLSARMNVLVGDSSADGAVNSADISQTKSQSGQGLTILNFREDLNADGAMNSADISLAKSRSGTALP